MREQSFYYDKIRLLAVSLVLASFAGLWTAALWFIGSPLTSQTLAFIVVPVVLLLLLICLFLSPLLAWGKPALYFDEYSIIIHPQTRKEIVVPWKNISMIYAHYANKHDGWLMFMVDNPKEIIEQQRSSLHRKLMQCYWQWIGTPVFFGGQLNVPLNRLHSLLLAELSQHKQLPTDSLFKQNPYVEHVEQMYDKSKLKK